MEGALSELLDAALQVAPANGANEAIAQMRAAHGEAGGPGLSYEVVVPAAEPWRHLTEVALPRLVYFLDCRGKLSAAPSGVVVSVFVGERLYFFAAGDFLAIVGRRASLGLDELRARWGERTGGPQAPGARPLLGG